MTQAITSAPVSLHLTSRLLHQLLREHLLTSPSSMNPRDSASDIDVDSIPLAARLAAGSRGVPVASTLSPSEIAESIGAGNDPWAEDLHGHVPTRLEEPPMKWLLSAVRFAGLCEKDDHVARFLAPGNITVLTIPRQDEREIFWRTAPDLKQAFAAINHSGGGDWSCLQSVVYGSESTGSRSEERAGAQFRESITTAIARGVPILAMVSHPRDMPEVAQALCDLTFTLPPLSRAMVLELLRVTHSATGQLAEDAVLAQLPGDDALGAMPLAVVRNAFSFGTTLRVAQRLAKIARGLNVKSGVTLDDMALPGSIRNDLDQIVADLSAWRSGTLDWRDVSASIFVHGPPGNGKTMVAACLAGSAGIPVVATSYADCQRHGHQGDYLKAMNEKVEEAIARAPCVFVVDEMDAYQVRNRSSRNSDYNIGVVNGLLEQLSRLNETPGVIVVGAANHPAMIEPAILRPGRFDRHYAIGSPDLSGIERILCGSLGSKIGDCDIAVAAKRLQGCSGATVAAVIRDAKAVARREGSQVNTAILTTAIERAAPMKPEADRHRIAIHEAGHVVVTWRLTGKLPITVRLTPEGGEVRSDPVSYETVQTARDRIAGLLAGRAAEQIIIGSISSGAADDLVQATEVAFMMHHSWALGGDSLIALPRQVLERCVPGAAMSDEIDDFLRCEAERAEQMVSQYRAKIMSLADILIRRTELTRADLAVALCTKSDNLDDQELQASPFTESQ